MWNTTGEFWRWAFSPVRLEFWGAVAGAAVSVLGGALSSKGGSRSKDPAGQAQAQIGLEQWDRYKKLGFPIESQVYKEVKAAGSPEDIAAAEAGASADVSASFNALRRNRAEELRARGVGDPTSPHALHESNSIGIAEAGARAGATRSARDYAKETGLAKRFDFLQTMKGNPAQALAGLAGASRSNQTQQVLDYNRQKDIAAGFGTIAAPFAKMGGDYLNNKFPVGGGTFGGGNSAGTFGGWSLSDPANQAAMRSAYGFRRGGLVRKYAGGGVIDGEVMGKTVGPGDETSDSIPAVIDGQEPAALSTDEFVLNAEATDILGEEFLNAANKIGLMRRYDNERPSGMRRGGLVRRAC